MGSGGGVLDAIFGQKHFECLTEGELLSDLWYAKLRTMCKTIQSKNQWGELRSIRSDNEQLESCCLEIDQQSPYGVLPKVVTAISKVGEERLEELTAAADSSTSHACQRK